MFNEIHPGMRPGIWPHEALVHCRKTRKQRLGQRGQHRVQRDPPPFPEESASVAVFLSHFGCEE